MNSWQGRLMFVFTISMALMEGTVNLFLAAVHIIHLGKHSRLVHYFQETHVIHTFKEDFYGQILSVVLVGYIRPERSYDSLDALIAAINHDIEEAKRKLDLPEHLKLKKDNFFIASASSSMTSSNKITKGH
ncbi:riboflavin kinase isoform X3 [Oncorhynchus tshawytscha]|uniref:riboflavin kinase isoform X3 n=1 Tax=Oncorhynchus tshawytscha TaxID=74940 RepID=UPI000D0A616F|nr:riboflavin kinase isoform X3 [Oncorhynchus tshawytscha]XP_042186569.1 riboflavin kinase isoform X3 [Oncorhynchus tshawytscha]